MASVRAVIFDFDGLLMDTESTSIASWEREWARWGLTLDRDAFFVPHGGDVTEHRYELLAAAVGKSYDRALSRERRTKDRDALNTALVLAAGVDGWLLEARDLGLAVAVASSSPVAWVQRHLRRVDAEGWFDVIVGGDLVEAHKPAPDVYQLALSRLGLEGHEAVAVEDTAHGVDAAHAAGMVCIAIPNPHVAVDRVAHADLVLARAAGTSLCAALDAACAGPRANDPARRGRGRGTRVPSN